MLKFGSLPFPILELSSEQISATLGDQFLSQSLLAGFLGIAMVITFMIIYYRAIGLVASFALIYYTLVVVAIFRLVPVTLTLAGIAGFVLSVGMAVDANILIFERMKEELRLGKSLPAGGRGGLQPGLELDPRLERVEPHHGHDPVRLRVVDDPGLRARADHRRPHLDVQRDRRHPLDHAGARAPGVGAPAVAATGCGKASWCTAARPGRRPAERLPSVFDVIGKRRWFYLFSLILTIPGLFFILLTPFTDAGLQFTIDYTGGTKWEIRFQDPAVTPDQVEAVFAEQGLEASAITTGSGFIEIKTVNVVGLASPPPSPTPVATLAPATASASASGSAGASPSASSSPATSASPAASGSPAASASPAPSASPGPSTSPSPAPSASAASSAAAGASGSPSPSASVAPVGNTELPSTGKLGAVREALESKLGKIAQQNTLTTIGAVVSSDLITQALILILVGSIGILLWITFRFHDVKFGVTALVALLHDVVLVVGVFAILGTLFGVEIDALFVTAMLTIIGFSVHDTIVVFDRVRENKARHAGEPFPEIVNHSILQTFGRSITTSLTVVLTLLALLLFGGSAINGFILALLIGIVSGTYSSIFVASPLLVDWHLWEDRKRGRLDASRAPRARRSVS